MIQEWLAEALLRKMKLLPQRVLYMGPIVIQMAAMAAHEALKRVMGECAQVHVQSG